MNSILHDSTALAENKVLILHFLSKIKDSITEDTLFKLLSLTNNINYFHFKEVLTDLLVSNLVVKYSKDDDEDNDKVFKLTGQGITAYDLTKDVLPGILRLQADTIFQKEFNFIKNEFRIISEFTPINEKNYTIKCKIIESNETIFEVKTFAGSRETAKKIIDNWNSNATNIYPKILNMLLDKNIKNTQKED